MDQSTPGPSAGPLTLRRVAIDTYRENVAYLHRDCAVYRAEGFQALSKVEITGNSTRIFAVLNVVDDRAIVTENQLGLSEQAFDQLGHCEGDPIQIAHAEPPRSMDAVRRKIRGERLDLKDFEAIAFEISDNRYSKMEMAAFLVAAGQAGLDRDEVLYLTRAMLEAGKRLDWQEPLVADKHCIGGIPGNRTSMLVVPIVDLLKKLGDPVRKGEALYRVHAEFQGDFKFARALHEERGGAYRIGEVDQVPKLYVEF
jgi:thymidine phosphorylase